MIELRMGEQDVLRLRFAVSPVWETLAALRVMTAASPPPALRPWLEQARPDRRDYPLLTALHARGRYMPDFLTPPPAAGERSIDVEIGLVAETPLPTVRTELRRCLAERVDVPPDDLLQLVAERPVRARELIVRELRLAWRSLLQDTWPRLHRVLATDVDHRSRQLVGGGIAALLEDLDPTVSWANGTLVVDTPAVDRRDLAGEGVVLMPSLFVGAQPVVILDPPYQPTLVYRARGIATAWSAPVAPADALITLLGRGRADLLAALDEPAGTGALAIALGRSPGTVSEHLHALRAAGLAEVRRLGKASRWSRTPLGNALVAGPLAP